VFGDLLTVAQIMGSERTELGLDAGLAARGAPRRSQL